MAFGLVNGISIPGFSLPTPFYGALVNVTGAYSASNVILMAAGVGITLVLILFTKETYGSRDH